MIVSSPMGSHRMMLSAEGVAPSMFPVAALQLPDFLTSLRPCAYLILFASLQSLSKRLLLSALSLASMQSIQHGRLLRMRWHDRALGDDNGQHFLKGQSIHPLKFGHGARRCISFRQRPTRDVRALFVPRKCTRRRLATH